MLFITGIIAAQTTKGKEIKMNELISSKSGLKYLVHEPQIKSVKHKAVILLHGVGSNEQDLFSLASQLPKDLIVISARGPVTLSEGSYAWYQVDFSTGKPVFNHEQEISSRKIIIDFITEIKKKYDLDEVYLGGFSQGAIMSFNVGLTHPELLKGIAVLSGRLMDEIKPSVLNAKDLQQLNVFLAHGNQDGTLQVAYAKAAKTYLEQQKVKLSYHEYAMGHQIIEQELNDLNSWFNAN
ncbi:esterase [Sphingobacteriaceae bacterium]|nr:esterase [Sphingobacteriaceae bacterium]